MGICIQQRFCKFVRNSTHVSVLTHDEMRGYMKTFVWIEILHFSSYTFKFEKVNLLILETTISLRKNIRPCFKIRSYRSDVCFFNHYSTCGWFLELSLAQWKQNAWKFVLNINQTINNFSLTWINGAQYPLGCSIKIYILLFPVDHMLPPHCCQPRKTLLVQSVWIICRIKTSHLFLCEHFQTYFLDWKCFRYVEIFTDICGLCCQKQVSQAGISNYIPQ